MEVLRFEKTSSKAIAPTKGSPRAAGYDLYSAEKVTVPAGGKCLVSTDLKIHLPKGSYGRVAPRSGLALKHFIDVGAGVIDEDYRGIVMVLLFNFGSTDFVVSEGDRVAQLICERIVETRLEEAVSLENTSRGAGGFGSTGI